jgi:hypothetical protein
VGHRTDDIASQEETRMDSNVYGIEEAVRQARRKLIEEWERKYSASLAHKYDTTSSLFATQEETLRERFRGVWKR